jgi:hypothetical protein
MFNESGQAAPGARECSRCGTRVNGSMKFCPHCGVNLLRIAPRERAPGGSTSRRSRQQFYMFASVALFAVAFAAYGIMHRSEGEPTPDVQVAQGPINTPEVVAVPASSPPSGDHAASAPPQALPAAQMPTQTPVQAQAQAQAPAPAPAQAANIEVAQQNAGPQANLREEQVAARKITASTHAGVARNLASARASLDKDSLWPARKAIMSALAEEPGNGEALQMRADLISREQERDSLLADARLCAREAQWVCAWQNAGHALTVDASSRQARELLSRAIAERGASTAGRPDAGPPSAGDDQ